MLQETFYGNDGFFSSNDSYDGDKSFAPKTSRSHEDTQVITTHKPEANTSFSGCNKRLDKYISKNSPIKCL